jgi:hypothetical protein
VGSSVPIFCQSSNFQRLEHFSTDFHTRINPLTPSPTLF